MKTEKKDYYPQVSYVLDGTTEGFFVKSSKKTTKLIRFTERKKGFAIKPNGEVEEFEAYDNDGVLLIKNIQDAVGYHLAELKVTVPDLDPFYELFIKHASEIVMIVDEEGLLKDNPEINEVASKLVGQDIVGTVVLLHRPMAREELIDLNDNITVNKSN